MNPYIGLPEGWVAQTACHTEVDGRCYEMVRVHDAAGRLVPDRSFWSITPLHLNALGPRPYAVPLILTYGEHRESYGRSAVPFAVFSAPVSPRTLERWVSAGHRRRNTGPIPTTRPALAR